MPTAQLGSLNLTTNTTQTLLRVVEGNLQNLKKGAILKISISRIEQGQARVNIQGASIILEGLNKNMAYKTLSFKVVQSGIHPQLALLNGEQKTKKETHETKPKTALKQQNLIFNPPKTGSKGILGRVSLQHQTLTAQIKSSPPAWLTHTKQPLPVIATEHRGKQVTLNITLPIQTNTSQQNPAINSAKQQQIIHIENPSRTIQVGEQFTIQLVAPNNHAYSHGKNILSLQPQTSGHLVPTEKKQMPPFTLPTGKIIIATVAQRLPSGHITFQWQGQSFESPAPKFVQPGDVLHLQVSKTGENPTFSILDHVTQAKAKIARIFRQNIGKTTVQHDALHTLHMIAEKRASTTAAATIVNTANQSPNPGKLPTQPITALSSLSHWIEQFALNTDQPVDGHRIANLLRHLGQHYESSIVQHLNGSHQDLQNLKQNDLKALLLELTAIGKQHPLPSILGQIGQTAEHGAARIESQQALNLMAVMQADPIRFELPMFFQGQLTNVYLSIQQDQHHKERNSNTHSSDKSSFNILFALNLTGLGALRIDARITLESVHARFYHDSDTSRQFVQQNMQRLEDKLQSSGYQSIYLGASPQSKMTHEKETQFTQLINNAPGGDGFLDVEA